jgi:hypothetical protein
MVKNSAHQPGWCAGLLALAIYLGILLALWLQSPGIARENGLMENLQALALAAGVLVSVAALLLPDRRRPRFIYFALTIFLLALFLREVDVDKLDLPGALIALGSGTGRNLLLAGAALLALVVFARDYRTLGPAVLALLKHRACYPFYLGILLYLLGDIFEKRWLGLSRPTCLFLEELCENAATGVYLWGTMGLAWGKRPKDD